MQWPRRPDGPPATSRPGPRLPLYGLRPGLQRLHRDRLPQDPPAALGDPADPPRDRSGRDYRAAGPRAEVPPPTPAEVAAPTPGGGPEGGRPAAAGRRR